MAATQMSPENNLKKKGYKNLLQQIGDNSNLEGDFIIRSKRRYQI